MNPLAEGFRVDRCVRCLRPLCCLLLLPVQILDSPPLRSTRPTSIRIGDYTYRLPVWWDSVHVDVPEGLETQHDIFCFVMRTYGSDVGTNDARSVNSVQGLLDFVHQKFGSKDDGKSTWKKALKTYALAEKRIKGYPVFVAHCHMTGGEYFHAAEVYAGLHALADAQDNDRDWYCCFLSYNAGLAYHFAGDFEESRKWALRAMEYVGHKEEAIDYYARAAAEYAR
jgi:hypothetical protein